MKSTTICLILVLAHCWTCQAQRWVIDPQHLLAVNQNGAVRSAAESTHEQYLSRINTSLNDLNTNAGTIVLAQNMIYHALSDVNSALKNGLEVKNMAVIVADILNYLKQAAALARDDPALLLVAGHLADEMRSHTTLLVNDVSGFVLKEGDNVLADYNARDQLLRKVTQQLQIMDGLAYGTWRAMFWAKARGLLASLNPFSAYINHDRLYVQQIIQKAKYLKP